MPASMDRESLLKLANNIIKADNQVRIATLSDELTISQVVKFFDKQGRSFTKTMIQNYVRVGVLPPPVDKRYYTKDHLMLLTLIDNMKSVFSLDEIKQVLEPIRNDPEVFEDDKIKMADVYKNYLAMRSEVLARWEESLSGLLDRINSLLAEDHVVEGGGNDAASFLLTLTIMAETIALKDLTLGILAENKKK